MNIIIKYNIDIWFIEKIKNIDIILIIIKLFQYCLIHNRICINKTILHFIMIINVIYLNVKYEKNYILVISYALMILFYIINSKVIINNNKLKDLNL
jgi:hypothetical protein